MIQKGDKVRHINSNQDKIYDLMEVMEIKNNHAVCNYGGYSNLGVVTFPLIELVKSEK